MARSGRYTLHPRACASASSAVPGVTYALTSAIAIQARYPPRSDPLDPHRVVVIARVLGVDRRERDVAQVLAPFAHRLGDLEAVRLGLGDRLVGVRLVDSLEHQDLRGLDRQLARPTEHDLDAPLGRLVGRLGPARDGDDDRVAVVAAVALGARGVDRARQDDGPANARVVRLEPGALALAPQRPGDARACRAR